MIQKRIVQSVSSVRPRTRPPPMLLRSFPSAIMLFSVVFSELVQNYIACQTDILDPSDPDKKKIQEVYTEICPDFGQGCFKADGQRKYVCSSFPSSECNAEKMVTKHNVTGYTFERSYLPQQNQDAYTDSESLLNEDFKYCPYAEQKVTGTGVTAEHKDGTKVSTKLKKHSNYITMKFSEYVHAIEGSSNTEIVTDYKMNYGRTIYTPGKVKVMYMSPERYAILKTIGAAQEPLLYLPLLAAASNQRECDAMCGSKCVYDKTPQIYAIEQKIRGVKMPSEDETFNGKYYDIVPSYVCNGKQQGRLLKPGEVAGLVIGLIILAALIAVLVVFLVWKFKCCGGKKASKPAMQLKPVSPSLRE